MADTQKQNDAPPAKAGKKGLLIGVAAMALLGGAGFYATYFGMILKPETSAAAEEAGIEDGHGETAEMAESAAGDAHGDAGHGPEESSGALVAGDLHGEPVIAGGSDIAFIPVNPLVVSLAGSRAVKHLRFTSQLEVPSRYSGEVVRMMPRVVDVMNGYLRAVDPGDLQAPGALVTLRSQMLRRVELVLGPGRVSDVLVMEFVLS